MINTKTAFTIFSILTIIVFPYYIFGYNSDTLSSIIPGWNTTIIPVRIMANLIKFVILGVVSFYYYKLSVNNIKLDVKKFLIHLSLTIPATLAAKLNIYQFVEMNLHNPESFLSQIQMVIYINTFINILFFTVQILFGVYYFRSGKNNNSLAVEK
ncbi:hypothetical protein B0A67_21490 [Flavobacterium aquidurense]|uniref:hypothetical protein n=1 Tax=Flavobacterium aquidurense TaxID=362413 RepID=UPI00090F1C53|nr:hypothetical protein [Flavobacterium aquidurense]OXA67830.1 hypothetical protein B0A67_21490 [Flavobacterium aquidurense]SHH81676.1 hypothetical protein SAMN05444481_13037 [Flavobacterium frigidimaris]